MAIYLAFLLLIVCQASRPAAGNAGNAGKWDASPSLTVDVSYWTPERRSKAKAKERLANNNKVTEMMSGPDGPEVAVEGFKGLNWNDSTSKQRVGDPILDPTQYPYTTVGRLYFTQAGNNYYATAVAVQLNTILTSGYAVFDGVWSSNAVYYPSYPSTTLVYPVNVFYAYTGWTQFYYQDYNYGFATTTNRNAFNPTGWAGTKWNVPLVNGLFWRVVGYSTAYPSYMYQTYGAIVLPQPIAVTGTQTVNNADGTISGNTWWNETGGTFFANGVNTFYYTSYPAYRYSPYFNTNFGELYYYVVSQQ